MPPRQMKPIPQHKSEDADTAYLCQQEKKVPDWRPGPLSVFFAPAPFSVSKRAPHETGSKKGAPVLEMGDDVMPRSPEKPTTMEEERDPLQSSDCPGPAGPG